MSARRAVPHGLEVHYDAVGENTFEYDLVGFGLPTCRYSQIQKHDQH